MGFHAFHPVLRSRPPAWEAAFGSDGGRIACGGFRARFKKRVSGALSEAKALAASQFAQYGMPSAPDDMLEGYAEKILADKDQGQKIYEKLYEVKVVEDVKSKVKVTEKAVSADDFAKLAKEL